MSFPDEFEPKWRLSVAGSVIDYIAAGISFDQLEAQQKDGDASLEFHVVGDAIGALPDPYLAKPILLEADDGTGYLTLFSGRCTRQAIRYQENGWVRTYTCKGLSYLANRVPVTNPIDGTDAITFNASVTDPGYLKELAARTVGAILRYTLDGQATAANLTAYGIGNYTATIGSGASATVSLAGAVTITNGGDGYSSATPPNGVLVGGDGTYTSISVAVDGGGHVTGATIGGYAGYTITPEIWISCLPVATLRSFALLTLIPQSSQTVQGERIFDSLKNLVHQTTRNQTLQIDLDGTIRVYDLRAPLATITLTLDSAADRVDLPSLSITRSVEDCFERVDTRGGPEIIPVLVGLKPNPNAPSYVTDNGLGEYFGHDGIDSNAAKLLWSLNDYTQPGVVTGKATASPSMGVGGSAGKVVAIAARSKGYGYTPGTVYNATISAPGGSGVTAAANSTADASGQLATWVLTNQGSGYTAPPNVKPPSPPGSNFDTGRITSISPGTSTSLITIQPDDHSKSWAANHYDQSDSGRHGTFFGISDSVLPGVEVRTSARIVANTAQVAGATSQLTVEGSVPSGYNSYEIFATAGGGQNVWQLYKLTANAPYAGKLAQHFPWPIPAVSSDGTGATMTSTALAWVLYSANGLAPYQRAQIGIVIDSTAGTIRTETPTVVPFGTHPNLYAGGASTNGIPDDVQALLPVIVGNLQAICPANTGYPAITPAYAGTSHTVEGLSETYTLTIPSWIDKGNQGQMDLYAADILDSVKDTILDGSVNLLRFRREFLASFGQAIMLDAAYVTPWDGIAIPVVSASLTWNRGKGNRYTTSLHVSNQREALAADYFVRPTHVGFSIGGDTGVALMGGVSFSGSSPNVSTPMSGTPGVGTPGVGTPGTSTPDMGGF